jgi:uncharacterized protein (TIGR02996 family)
VIFGNANKSHENTNEEQPMAIPTQLTEEQISRLASTRTGVHAGLELVRRGRYSAIRRSADGAWLAASCKGREDKPYAVVVDLSDPNRPVGRCTCYFKDVVQTTRSFCKHMLGLLFLRLRAPEQFTEINTQEIALADHPAGDRQAAENGNQRKTLEEAFLKSIREEPTEDAHRLIYADWLEEQGDADSLARAEFIRLQCQLWQQPVEKRNRPFRLREKQLWEEHRDKWLTTVPEPLRTPALVFHRGFLEEVNLPLVRFLEHADDLFAHNPLHRLTLRDPLASRDVSTFVACPHLARLTALSLERVSLTSPTLLKTLLTTPYLDRLTRLNLSWTGLTSAGVAILVTTPLLGHLKELLLVGNRITDQGIVLLADCPALAQLTHLNLSDNSMRTKGATALANAPHLRQLASLDLRGNSVIGPRGKMILQERFGDKVLFS